MIKANREEEYGLVYGEYKYNGVIIKAYPDYNNQMKYEADVELMGESRYVESYSYEEIKEKIDEALSDIRFRVEDAMRGLEYTEEFIM